MTIKFRKKLVIIICFLWASAVVWVQKARFDQFLPSLSEPNILLKFWVVTILEVISAMLFFSFSVALRKNDRRDKWYTYLFLPILFFSFVSITVKVSSEDIPSGLTPFYIYAFMMAIHILDFGWEPEDALYSLWEKAKEAIMFCKFRSNCDALEVRVHHERSELCLDLEARGERFSNAEDICCELKMIKGVHETIHDTLDNILSQLGVNKEGYLYLEQQYNEQDRITVWREFDSKWSDIFPQILKVLEKYR